MTTGSWIAVDAMGGDEGLAVMLAGVAEARRRYDGTHFFLVGDETAIAEGLKKHPNLTANSEIVHAPDVIRGDEKPSAALRRAKTTSMGVAIDLVKQGRAAAAVSSGNTGALMAMAKVSLRTMKGIDRPALAGLMPSLGEHDTVVLDLGANTECDARNLEEFAIMGAAYARTMLDLESPKVALLNIGTEDMKGTGDHPRGGAGAARRDAFAADLHRVHRGRQIVARRRRCDRVRRLFGQRRAQDGRRHRAVRRRPAADRLLQFGALEDRLPDLAPGDRRCCATGSIPTIIMARCFSGSTGWW